MGWQKHEAKRDCPGSQGTMKLTLSVHENTLFAFCIYERIDYVEPNVIFPNPNESRMYD
jgi:hypothetical protein